VRCALWQAVPGVGAGQSAAEDSARPSTARWTRADWATACPGHGACRKRPARLRVRHRMGRVSEDWLEQALACFAGEIIRCLIGMGLALVAAAIQAMSRCARTPADRDAIVSYPSARFRLRYPTTWLKTEFVP
jgi:hypothetical protein